MNTSDQEYMQLAIAQAEMAGRMGEVPVGAILVGGHGQVVAAAHNRTITRCDPTAHAEMLVLRQAAEIMGNYRLLNTTIYVTVEPCIMCMGACVHARVERVVYGAADLKWGAAGSLYDFSREPRLNHHPRVSSGVREATCRQMMQNFFRAKRAQAKS